MKAEFYGSIPDIQSAIKISGNGAIRLQVDVPETELAEAIKIVAARGEVIKVTMEWDDAD